MIKIEIELHISLKHSAIKELKDLGYDNSQSTLKNNEQRKKNLRSVYALIKFVLEEVFHSTIIENSLSGNKNYTKLVIKEDSLIMRNNENTYKFNIFVTNISNFYYWFYICYFQIILF